MAKKPKTQTMAGRIIYYYQKNVGMHEIKADPSCRLTHVIISAGHFINNQLILNDNPATDECFDSLWTDLKNLTQRNQHPIQFLFMLGGAGGAYRALFANYEACYAELVRFLRMHQAYLTGIDLDVEEPDISTDQVVRLVSDLRVDFPLPSFVITLAPTQEALESPSGQCPFSSDLSYRALQERLGANINWFNVQMYTEFSCERMALIVANGFPAKDCVLGVLGSGSALAPANVSTASWEDLKTQVALTVKQYPDLGGVVVWEYFIAPPDPEKHLAWAQEMQRLMRQEPPVEPRPADWSCVML